MAQAPLYIDVASEGDGVARLHLIGDFDLAGRQLFIDTWSATVAPGRTVIIDFADVPFCDSSAISCLIRAHKDAASNNAVMVLVGVNAMMRRLLAVTHLDHLFTIHDDHPGEHSAPTASQDG